VSLHSCSDDASDFGLRPEEVSHTLERLFAIPTAAYANAYGEAGADMRPAMPTFTYGPQDGGIMKLAMPTFALSQSPPSRTIGTALAQQHATQEEVESHTWPMASQWLTLTQKSSSTAPVHPVERSHALVSKPSVQVVKGMLSGVDTSPATKALDHLAMVANAIASKQLRVQAATAPQAPQQMHAALSLSGII